MVFTPLTLKWISHNFSELIGSLLRLMLHRRNNAMRRRAGVAAPAGRCWAAGPWQSGGACDKNAQHAPGTGQKAGSDTLSETDSFINEVTEEVRRDRLYALLRRWGWVAALAVLALVGGAAWTEYSRAQDRAQAEATGDALLAAMTVDAPEARAAALSDVAAPGASAAVVDLLTAATEQEAGDAAAAADRLNALALNPEVPQIYRDVAAFKAAMIDTGDTAARRDALTALAQPGATFALLAQEQLALMDLAAGETDTAMASLRAIAEDAGATEGLRQRAQSLIVALGGTVEAAPPAAAADAPASE